MIKNTYTIQVRCSNCDYEAPSEKPVGQKIASYYATTECPNCGCDTLREFPSAKRMTETEFISIVLPIIDIYLD